jgi:5-oxoprolinase (ATP-hydrolysing) subunit A
MMAKFARTIDLNADLAEDSGDDAAMLALVTSANLCCGAHAGGPTALRLALQAARALGVVVGAHPGFADRVNFGRVIVSMSADDITRMVADQVAQTLTLAAKVGARVDYVKPHGALYNLAADDPAVAAAVAAGIAAADRGLMFLGLAGSAMLMAGQAAGLHVAAEAFADRAYQPDGRLVPRAQPGAVLHDPHKVAARAVAMVRDGAVTAIDGRLVPLRFDSLCLHGDTPGAVAMAQAVRTALQAQGIVLRPFARPAQCH